MSRRPPTGAAASRPCGWGRGDGVEAGPGPVPSPVVTERPAPRAVGQRHGARAGDPVVPVGVGDVLVVVLTLPMDGKKLSYTLCFPPSWLAAGPTGVAQEELLLLLRIATYAGLSVGIFTCWFVSICSPSCHSQCSLRLSEAIPDDNQRF